MKTSSFLLLVLALSWSVSPTAAQTELEELRLTIAFCSTSVPHLNPNDQAASLRAFVETVGRRRGYRMVVETLNFADSGQFGAALARTPVHIAILDTWDYLTENAAAHLDPVFVPLEEGVLAEPYLLLTKRGSGLDDLASLRGRDLILLHSLTANLGAYWLDVLLAESGCGRPAEYFAKVHTVAKSSAAILPVFFGGKGACLTDQASFDVMMELNPQVGKALQVVSSSEPLVDSLIFLGRAGWVRPKHREDIRLSLAELHLEPAGRQVLTLFKTQKLIPFEDGHLATVRKLMARHGQFGGGAGTSARPNGGSPPAAGQRGTP